MSKRIPRPEHPRPDWKRDSFVSLNGEWQFEIDNTETGEERELYKADALSGKIILPFCPESELSGVGNKDFMYCVWYKRKLTVSAKDLQGKRLILHFGAADFETKLWVNGVSAGLSHIGGYTPFEYDITALLSDGENDLTVACYDDLRCGRQPSGKQSRKNLSYGCYYTRTTGIWQTVWYELVPESHIKYAKLTPDVESCSVSVSCELAGVGDFSATVFYNGKTVGRAEKKGQSTVSNLDIPLAEKHLWELGAGRLYDVELAFGEDKVHTYFGLRSVDLNNGKFNLNGKPVFMRLVLDQGFWPDGIYTASDEAAIIKDIECGLAAGFNGARLHEKVFEPLYLYHADRLGYMVWGEYASWGIDHSNIKSLATFLPDWLASVRRDYNHPSVIGWCPFNETWDMPSGAKQSDEFLRIVYEMTKLTDPTRPCIDTSGNFHVVTDIFDVHDYEQDPKIFKGHYDALYEKGELYDKVTHNPRHHATQKWKGEPVFMSEYGGTRYLPEGSSGGGAWGYGNAVTTHEEFYARYKALTDALLDNPKMLGFCYTQLTDVEQEQNGLFTYEGRVPKFDPERICAINKRPAAIEKE